MDSGINDLIRTVFDMSIDEGESNDSIDLYNNIELDRPMKGFVGLSQKHVDAMKLISDSIRLQLKALNIAYGLNIEDENFRETPERIAKMMILETCHGINSEQLCISILSKHFPSMGEQTNSNIIVTTNPAIVYSICPHHFSVVTYKVWTGYIPDKSFVGISKFHRVVELYAAQPILQESYSDNLCDIFMKSLNPKGAICIVQGIHQCMTTRGAKSNPKSPMTTYSIKCDSSIDSQKLKDDFLSLCIGFYE